MVYGHILRVPSVPVIGPSDQWQLASHALTAMYSRNRGLTDRQGAALVFASRTILSHRSMLRFTSVIELVVSLPTLSLPPLSFVLRLFFVSFLVLLHTALFTSGQSLYSFESDLPWVTSSQIR
jgi:hypothetical protein